jgi:hypothetical protein
MDLLRVIDRDSLGSLFLATCTALLAAYGLCGKRGRGIAKLVACAALVAYLIHAWPLKPVKSAERVQELILRSLAAAGFAYAAARFALSLLIALYRATLGKLFAGGHAAPPAAEEPKPPVTEQPPGPPAEPAPEPPTPEVRAAEAKKRYDESLRLIDAAGLDATEATAAKAHAKKKYLKELEGIIQ